MSKGQKRYVLLMVIGVLMNLGFYSIAHNFHLPAWIDNLGTAFTALLLEPTAGLLVAFTTNFYQAAFIYDSSSLIYYATSASVALIVGIGMRKHGKICWKRSGITLVGLMIIPTLIAATITMWRTGGGVSDSGWEHTFYLMATDNGLSNFIACYFSTFVLKFVDAIIIVAALPVFNFITPKSLITMEHEKIVSWDTPYFKKKEE